MTVEELRRILADMPGENIIHVRIQGVNRPLVGAFTETVVQMTPEAVNKFLDPDTDPSEVVATERINHLILSDRWHH